VGVALAGLLEAEGRRAAQIDLDEVWAMVDHQLPRRGTVADWSLARAGAAALADTFFAAGVDVVIVNGPFYTLEERTQLTDRLRTRADVRYVTLTVEFEEALRRTRADPDHRRGLSREREWLERKHREAAAWCPALRDTDLIVEPDGRDLPTVAALIAGSLAQRS
jgi:hypothetical protein